MYFELDIISMLLWLIFRSSHLGGSRGFGPYENIFKHTTSRYVLKSKFNNSSIWHARLSVCYWLIYTYLLRFLTLSLGDYFPSTCCPTLSQIFTLCLSHWAFYPQTSMENAMGNLSSMILKDFRFLASLF